MCSEDLPVKIYLDVCCLNRPFDDHSQIRMEVLDAGH